MFTLTSNNLLSKVVSVCQVADSIMIVPHGKMIYIKLHLFKDTVVFITVMKSIYFYCCSCCCCCPGDTISYRYLNRCTLLICLTRIICARWFVYLRTSQSATNRNFLIFTRILTDVNYLFLIALDMSDLKQFI